MSDEMEGKHGVQSLEIGMGILRAMVNGQRSMMLKDIAAAAEMPASKAHRYLVSLIRAGLVEQDPLTSRYDIGPFALNIGLVAIDRLDRVRLGLAAIAELRDVKSMKRRHLLSGVTAARSLCAGSAHGDRLRSMWSRVRRLTC
jgi:predicted transcriptional regulator